MKKLVYLCVLTASVALVVNCAPKDKLLRQPNTKDPEVAQMEISGANGFDYATFLTTKAAEAKQLLELSLSKEIRQPEKSCVDVRLQYTHSDKDFYRLVGDNCAYESGENHIIINSNEELTLYKQDKKITEVFLETFADDQLEMKPKGSKSDAVIATFNPVHRKFRATLTSATKSERIFEVNYTGNMQYAQSLLKGKLRAEEAGRHTFEFSGIFHVSADNVWVLENPKFNVAITGLRTLTNSKRRTEKISNKKVDIQLNLEAYKDKTKKVLQTLTFVGSCDRLSGALKVASYTPPSFKETGFTGVLALSEDQMIVGKQDQLRRRALAPCESRIPGYAVKPPLDLLYLK